MKITKQRTLVFLLLLSFFTLQIICVLEIPEARAGNLWEMQEGREKISEVFGESPDKATDVRVVMVNIIKIFLTFVGIIFLIMIILGGYKWMTAAGNEDKVREAKSQLKTAIIGIIIILAAYVITEFIAEEVRKAMFEEVW